MRVSKAGIETLMDMEAVETVAYHDEAQKLTIGIGHLLTQNELDSGFLYIDGQYISWGAGITRDQSGRLLAQDMRIAEDAVNRLVTVPLEQHQFDALVFFCFNVGVGGFELSTLLKKLNQGRYEDVPTQMRRWVYVTRNGERVVSKGLVNRREREIKIWKGASNG
jgi:lysozyme